MLLLFLPVTTDLETLVRSAATKATNTELTQNSEFTQVLSTMLKQLHQTLNVNLRSGWCCNLCLGITVQTKL